MLNYILIALFNGVAIGTSRTINGRLSVARGPWLASLWNHLVGFGFLTLTMIVFKSSSISAISHAPIAAYAGGVIGVFFVALNSYVIPKIGSIMTVVLVICGQIVSGVVIDFGGQSGGPSFARLLGIGLVIIGGCLAMVSKSTTRPGSRPSAPKSRISSRRVRVPS